jgi:hypothetical protein
LISCDPSFLRRLALGMLFIFCKHAENANNHLKEIVGPFRENEMAVAVVVLTRCHMDWQKRSRAGYDTEGNC